MNRNVEQLQTEAKRVLRGNRTDTFTKPTSNLYPHQWSWDSCFIAIGYSHYDQHWAQKELQHLFDAQWKNGMIPHIVFDDRGFEDKYFPGPSFWQIDRSEQAPQTAATSGICQPPVHATAVRAILNNASDRSEALQFAKNVYPNLKKWHNYLYDERDVSGDGLVYIRHPWESGQDNSPAWDPVLSRIDTDLISVPEYERRDTGHVDAAERPDDEDYDRYIYLVDLFRKAGYDEKAIREAGCPFLVEDVLFNTILCQANRDLAEIAEMIGEDGSQWRNLAEKTAASINQKHWSEHDQLYVNYDVVAEKQINERILAGFLPLYGGIPDQQQAETLFGYLNTTCFCQLVDDCLAVPTFDRSSPEYSSSKYWRGPIWINLNWMLCLGLSNYGFHDYARRIMESIIWLPQNSGFREYFDPDTGQGYGTDCFSWTAALLLDVLHVREKKRERIAQKKLISKASSSQVP